MECGFCRRQGEDQPAMTRIHGFEPEDVAEKGAVRLSVPELCSSPKDCHAQHNDPFVPVHAILSSEIATVR